MPNLTREQQDVVRGVMRNVKRGEQVTTMSGYAGTGKTTCLAVLSEILSNYAICAYTGKAANVLRKKGMTASTIHSLIYRPETSGGFVEFVLIPREELWCDGFIVDEASMVSREIYEDLVSFGLPIVFVGDHGQLEPVGQDVNVMKDPQYRLETVHRNAGEIAHFAEHLRKGSQARSFMSDRLVEFVEPSEVTDEMLCGNDQMIAAYNRFRVEQNERVRGILGRKKIVEVGERVMCLRNNKRQCLFNGMQGVVTKVRLGKAPKLDFISDNLRFNDIQFDPNQFGKEKNQFEFGADTPNPFDYAYCITAHKSQGDEWGDVMVFEQVCDKWDHRRWAYTSASRAKQKLRWVCPRRHVPAWL